MKTLILRHNSFEDEGAKLLKDSLIENDTLQSLDLSWNHFQWRGCCTIAEGVAVSLQQITVTLQGLENKCETVATS